MSSDRCGMSTEVVDFIRSARNWEIIAEEVTERGRLIKSKELILDSS